MYTICGFPIDINNMNIKNRMNNNGKLEVVDDESW